MIATSMFMMLALLLYIAGCMYFPMDSFSTVVTTITAIIGAFAIWFQMKREKDIKEAEFIMSYNTSFMENQEMVDFEHQLEIFRIEYEKILDNTEEEIKLHVLKFSNLVTEQNIKAVINYLVYHEALAALIKKGVLKIDSIDPLFSYRFFLVMNNPIVQEKELCKDSQYYQGCFWLYKKWMEYRRKQNLDVLLENFSLHKTKEYGIINKL